MQPRRSGTDATIAAVRAAIADDLDTRRALAAVDGWAERTLGGAVGRRGARPASWRAVEPAGVRLTAGRTPTRQDVASPVRMTA